MIWPLQMGLESGLGSQAQLVAMHPLCRLQVSYLPAKDELLRMAEECEHLSRRASELPRRVVA
jgi:hypothetical protein